MPPENFNLVLLTFELEFVKKGTKEEDVIVLLFILFIIWCSEKFEIYTWKYDFFQKPISKWFICIIFIYFNYNGLWQVDAVLLSQQIKKRFMSQVWTEILSVLNFSRGEWWVLISTLLLHSGGLDTNISCL